MTEVYEDQVRLLLRVLPLVAEEASFALKGGTAINLFERDLPRLSVDIDLTYLPFEERDVALPNIEAALTRLKTRIEGMDGRIKVTPVPQKEGNDAKLHIQHVRAQIKIEVNTTLRGHVFPPRLMICSDGVQEQFETFVEMPVVSKAELYGGKLCAAFDRQHPRDLFDVYYLFKDEGLTREIMLGLIVAVLSGKRPINEVLFPTFKNQREAFENQFVGMSFAPFSYEDYEATRLRMVAAIKAALTERDKAFLLSFKRGKPDWDLIELPALRDMASVQWKLSNIIHLRDTNPEKHRALLTALSECLAAI